MAKKKIRKFDQTTLALVAHCDDFELGMGGTAAKLVAEAWDFHVLVLSSHRRRREDSAKDVAKLSQAREAEAKCGAESLGVPADNVHFLRAPEGEAERDIVGRVHSLLETLFGTHRPPLPFVFTHSDHDRHPDHVRCNEVARAAFRVPILQFAVVSSADSSFSSDVCVDITRFFEPKVTAFRQHRSQRQLRAGDRPVLAVLQEFDGRFSDSAGFEFAESFELNTLAMDSQVEPVVAICDSASHRQKLINRFVARSAHPHGGDTPSSEKELFYPRGRLQAISRGIYVPSEDDPEFPEFPPESPRFPASDPREIDVHGRRVVVKDESTNPTGTHKDRWAWELMVQYKRIITESLSDTSKPHLQLPRFSLISSGSAAVALQFQLRRHGLPDLRVIMDKNRTTRKMKERVESFGAIIYPFDLESRVLSERDVLEITSNLNGIDVTPRYARQSINERFYDWLVYEILNLEPSHIFVPFGTGSLYANIIYILDDESKGRSDPRLMVSGTRLKNVAVYGATTDNAQTQMHMLYAPTRPAQPGIEAAVKQFISDGVLGDRSGIFQVTDEQARGALAIGRSYKINSDLSGVAALALCKDMMTDIPEDERIVVLNTGAIFLPPA